MTSTENICIGIDIGGTKMRVALIDRAGSILLRNESPTLAHEGRDQAVQRLIKMIDGLVESISKENLAGIGVSVASPVEPNTGTMYNPPNLPGWNGFSLKSFLEMKFNIPTWAANDATLGAVGEYAYGVGQGISNIIYLTISTGIGGGIIVDGNPILGARGFAGELGHMSIDRNGPLCACGNVGCLEIFAAGTAVAKFARERLERGEASMIQEKVCGDLTRVDAKVVMEAAGQGDSLAKELIEQFAKDLGLGIANLIHIFDPEIIILGGGVTQSSHLYSRALDAAIHRNVMFPLTKHIKVINSVLGDDVSLLGAAYLVFQSEER